jgi:hypothetical protein
VLVLHVALKSVLDEQKHRAKMVTILRRQDRLTMQQSGQRCSWLSTGAAKK